MVMENSLTPQWVGREFVRQYYTLLNRAPDHLHRFYNNESSFVHGTIDTPNREAKVAIGQKQIHQRIQQLNFNDCHAKIIQVDCQSTLGDGVVIQVTGQLSNCGQPMRHFTQTFVLAAQSPRKYYVHNDIFRYQDIVINEDKSEEEQDQDSVRSEAEEESELETSPPADSVPANSQQVTPQMAYYVAPSPVLVSPQQSQPVASNLPLHPVPPQTNVSMPVIQPVAVVHQPATGTANAPSAPVNIGHQPSLTGALPPSVPVPYNAPSPELNVSVSHDDLINATSVASAPVMGGDDLQVTVSHGESDIEPLEGSAAEPVIEELMEDIPESEEPKIEEDEDTEKIPYPEVLEESQNLAESTNEPKTYATLVKSGGMGGVGTPAFVPAAVFNTNAPSPTSPPPSSRPSEPRDVVTPQMVNVTNVQSMRGPARGARGGPTIRGMRNDRPSSGRGNFNDDGGSTSGDGDRRRSNVGMQQHADNQQLFLGNLPLHATEEDLKQLFCSFGKVVDLRIHSKQNSKGPGGNRVPNYGFITFEDSATVQNVLKNRPFYFPSPGGQKLNVEEKKICQRQAAADAAVRANANENANFGNRVNTNGGGSRPIASGMIRAGGPGPGRGGRGGFTRGDDRGGSMNRGVSYVRR